MDYGHNKNYRYDYYDYGDEYYDDYSYNNGYTNNQGYSRGDGYRGYRNKTGYGRYRNKNSQCGAKRGFKPSGRGGYSNSSNYSRGSKKGYKEKSTYHDKEMMAVRNEVMVQNKLYNKQNSTASQKNSETDHVGKPKNEKSKNPIKMINNDSQVPIKQDRDAMSIASVKTTNTQSKLLDFHHYRHDEFVEKRSVDNADTDSQISQNNVMVKPTIKKTNRTFFPSKKQAEESKLADGTEQVEVKILASGNREISKKISLKPSPTVPVDDKYLLVDTKDGRTLILPLDVDAVAKQINDEVYPTQDLIWPLRCRIIEIIQNAIYMSNLFS